MKNKFFNLYVSIIFGIGILILSIILPLSGFWSITLSSAQEGFSCLPINFEQTVEGQLERGGEPDYYCFFVESANQVVSIRMFNIADYEPAISELDPYIFIYGPDGYRIEGNYDGDGIGKNSFLTALLLKEGFYVIEAGMQDWNKSGGTYRLRLESGFEAAVGDVNRDCSVDEKDRQLLFDALGSEAQNNQNLDLDLNGVISTRDMMFLLRNIGIRCI